MVRLREAQRGPRLVPGSLQGPNGAEAMEPPWAAGAWAAQVGVAQNLAGGANRKFWFPCFHLPGQTILGTFFFEPRPSPKWVARSVSGNMETKTLFDFEPHPYVRWDKMKTDQQIPLFNDPREINRTEAILEDSTVFLAFLVGEKRRGAVESSAT